nr:PREDICTED: ATP-dependent DNA helicase PIF1-like [Megachile rotundata]
MACEYGLQAKSEPQSQNFREVFVDVIGSCDPNEPAKKAFTRLLHKLVGQRDISACEVMHHLTGNALFHCSRQFVKLFISTDDYLIVCNDDVAEYVPRSIFEHYANRTQGIEGMSLKEYASEYFIQRRVLRKCRATRILQVIPIVKANVSEVEDEVYYKQKLMVNKPWRDSDALKTHTTLKESYMTASLDFWELPDIQSMEDEDGIDAPEYDPHEWIELVAAFPNLLPVEYLANQDNILTKNPNEQQAQIIHFLSQQLCKENLDKLVLVQGVAGTGKSFLINKMFQTVESIYGHCSVLLMAPTGVAANNINGQTIHSALRITQSRGTLTDLSGAAEKNYQESMQNCRVIICDEMSMVGLRMLSFIDKRLRQAYPSRQEQPFGGYIVYFFGDFNQLPPVMDRSLLSIPDTNNADALHDRFLYEQFTKVFEITQIMRQIGEEQKQFRETLGRIALGEVTQADYDLLSTKKDDIREYNYAKLRALNQPVALIKAQHNNITASQASEDEAHGLPAVLQISTGCCVILRQNLCTPHELCNGILGTVTDIVYSPEVEYPLDAVPLCILVEFDGYNGPTVYDGLIPIVPQTVAFRKDKAVIDIGPKEFAFGLTYVALSRVKTFQGLLIDPSFPRDRLLKSVNNNAGWRMRKNELARIRGLAEKNNN